MKQSLRRALGYTAAFMLAAAAPMGWVIFLTFHPILITDSFYDPAAPVSRKVVWRDWRVPSDDAQNRIRDGTLVTSFHVFSVRQKFANVDTDATTRVTNANVRWQRVFLYGMPQTIVGVLIALVLIRVAKRDQVNLTRPGH
jgi:hypothetical protein